MKKSSIGHETVDVLPDTCVVNLSIAVGTRCSWNTVELAYCCDTDDLCSESERDGRDLHVHVLVLGDGDGKQIKTSRRR